MLLKFFVSVKPPTIGLTVCVFVDGGGVILFSELRGLKIEPFFFIEVSDGCYPVKASGMNTVTS